MMAFQPPAGAVCVTGSATHRDRQNRDRQNRDLAADGSTSLRDCGTAVTRSGLGQLVAPDGG